MTAERNLIAAVLEAAYGYPVDIRADHILTTPAVQAALAKVRAEWSEISGDLSRLAKPEPVLRWEGDRLWLGEHYAGQVEKVSDWGKWSAEVRLGWEVTFHATREEATASIEQAVRDWLKRAGCV